MIHFFSHCLVRIVKIWLPNPKYCVIVSGDRRIPDFFPPWTSISWIGCRPDVPIMPGGLRLISRLDKPGMYIGCMVIYHINDHSYSPFMAFLHQPLKIIQCTIIRINPVIIGYVITMVGCGWVDRHQPDPSHT